MNKFIVTGNITKDAELRYTANDKAYSKFCIANNEGYGDNKKATFIPVTIFNKMVENLEEYLIKGTKVNIVGKLDIKNEETEDGYRTYVSVIAEELQLLKVAEPQETEEKKNG